MISYLKNENCVNRENVFLLFCFVINILRDFVNVNIKKCLYFLLKLLKLFGDIFYVKNQNAIL